MSGNVFFSHFAILEPACLHKMTRRFVPEESFAGELEFWSKYGTQMIQDRVLKYWKSRMSRVGRMAVLKIRAEA